jgi:hypothetical protein
MSYPAIRTPYAGRMLFASGRWAGIVILTGSAEGGVVPDV